MFKVEKNSGGIDPLHDDIPTVRSSSHPDSADPVWEVALAVTGHARFYERLVEVGVVLDPFHTASSV